VVNIEATAFQSRMLVAAALTRNQRYQAGE